MTNQKVRRERIKYPYRTERDIPVLGREKEMKEEKEEPKELLCPKAGTATSFPKRSGVSGEISFAGA
jgi:hypothetical protein